MDDDLLDNVLSAENIKQFKGVSMTVEGKFPKTAGGYENMRLVIYGGVVKINTTINEKPYEGYQRFYGEGTLTVGIYDGKTGADIVPFDTSDQDKSLGLEGRAESTIKALCFKVEDLEKIDKNRYNMTNKQWMLKVIQLLDPTQTSLSSGTEFTLEIEKKEKFELSDRIEGYMKKAEVIFGNYEEVRKKQTEYGEFAARHANTYPKRTSTSYYEVDEESGITYAINVFGRKPFSYYSRAVVDPENYVYTYCKGIGYDKKALAREDADSIIEKAKNDSSLRYDKKKYVFYRYIEEHGLYLVVKYDGGTASVMYRKPENGDFEDYVLIEY